MPGTNAGTGQPHTFWCAKCRRRKNERSFRPGHEATGRIKKLSPSQCGNGGSRVLQIQVEYRCLRCGHVGWSRHIDMRNLLYRYLETKSLDELRELHAGDCPREGCAKGKWTDWKTCAWHQILWRLITWREEEKKRGSLYDWHGRT